jgi:dTDP-4-amino-4,6-dideoxygalactose transaminase
LPEISIPGRQWPHYRPGTIETVAELLAQGRSFDYYRGPEISELEDRLARRADRQYALTFNSGTSAMLAAFAAVGIGPGDEVVVPTLTFLATASPLFLLGAVPVLCDAGDDWGNVTAATLEQRITSKTRALVVTHLWGQPCELEPILALATKRGLPLIADCSHAHGSTYRGHDVGAYGDIAVFSLGSHKVISGGNAGVLLCDDALYHDTGVLLGHFKQRRTSIHSEARRQFSDIGLGANLRISPVAAVLAGEHAERLDDLLAAKAANVRRVVNALTAAVLGLAPVLTRPGTTRDGWYGVMLRAIDGPRARDVLLDQLRAAGLPVTTPQTTPLHLTSIFGGHVPSDTSIARRVRLPADRTYRPGDLPLSELLTNCWISLPATFLHDDAHDFVEEWCIRTGAMPTPAAV